MRFAQHSHTVTEAPGETGCHACNVRVAMLDLEQLAARLREQGLRKEAITEGMTRALFRYLVLAHGRDKAVQWLDEALHTFVVAPLDPGKDARSLTEADLVAFEPPYSDQPPQETPRGQLNPGAAEVPPTQAGDTSGTSERTPGAPPPAAASSDPPAASGTAGAEPAPAAAPETPAP